MSIKYGAMILVLSACGAMRADPEFTPYINEFIDQAALHDVAIHTDGLEIKFEDMEGKDGHCHHGITHNTISVKQRFWNRADDYEKKLLLFHELGHCVLGRKHLDSVNGFEPVSIMHSYKRAYLNVEYEYYMNELFDKEHR